MATTPTLAQATEAYRLQHQIGHLAAADVLRLLNAGAGVPGILASVAVHQQASAQAAADTVAGYTGSSAALTAAGVFAGVSSHGFPISEPIVALIDAIVAAPVEAVPDVWWTQTQIPRFAPRVAQLVRSEVVDAGRTASQVEFVTRPDWTNYVRMLVGTSCDRCVVLAGRIYRDLEAFDRHPDDDCIMVPVDRWEDAHDAGYVTSAKDAFDKGLVTGLSEADAQAVRDGADITKVVNAKRGMTTATVFGRRVKAATAGTTKRSAWRRANPTRLVRLRPESIYDFATDRADAVRLLKLYGWLT